MNPNQNFRQISPADSSNINEGTKRQAMRAVNCAKVGTIKAFNPANQQASVQLSMKQVISIAEDGTRTLQEYPILLEVPVVVLFGGVDILTLPIAVGDSCLVFFTDHELDQWKYNGDDQAPLTLRNHNITDAVAIVGIRPLTNSITNYLANGIRLSHGEGNSQMDLKDDLIETIAALFLHHGDMEITGNLTVDGDAEVKGDATVDGDELVKGGLTVLGTTKGNGGTITLDDNVVVTSGHTLTAPVVNSGNGATGSFNVVTVVNGIVTGGS